MYWKIRQHVHNAYFRKWWKRALILHLKFASGVNATKGKELVHQVNNGLQNLGNANSGFNYGSWGSSTN